MIGLARLLPSLVAIGIVIAAAVALVTAGGVSLHLELPLP